MKILGQRKRGLWDIDNVQVISASYPDNPVKLYGKSTHFIGAIIDNRSEGVRETIVVLGEYSEARCQDVIVDIASFFQKGGIVYEMPEE